MQHLDEHTLAFYALGVEFPPSEKQLIEAHLAECNGCLSRLEELRQINEHVASSADEASDPGATPEALVPVPRAISRRPGTPPIHVRQRSTGAIARMAGLVRDHPFATGSTTVVFALLAFLAIQNLLPWTRTAREPAWVRLNAQGTALEIYGRDNNKLWEILLTGRTLQPEERERFEASSTRIADLDGDGKPEVITTVPYREGENERTNVLRIFDARGNLRVERRFGGPLTFNNTSYSGSFGLFGLVVITRPGTGRKELLVEVINDRSPSFLARLDSRGNTLGEYWHFGWLQLPRLMHLQGDSRDLILLVGTNDVAYRTGETFPAMVVLDPAKMEGQSESPQTRGFGFPPSQAEVYYVKGGGINPALVTRGKFDHPSFLEPVKTAEDSSFSVPYGFLSPDDRFQVMFTFDSSVRVRSVWMPDFSLHMVMDSILVRSTPAGLEEFYQDLQSKIEYWDGTRWQKKPTAIAYPLTARNDSPSK